MLRIQSSLFEADILPEIGGKIGQIRDRESGYEFLIPPQRPYRTIPEHGDWTHYDTSGMDDCFPNIGIGPYPWEPWTGVQLPDLGHWTHGSWSICEAGLREAVLERRDEFLPHHARKTIRFVDDRTLELSYRLVNTGSSPFRYMWAVHPLISVGAEFELRLSAGDIRYRIFPGDHQLHSWPAFGSTDLSRAWIAPGSDLKIFLTGMREGWCELQLPAHSLRLSFDLDETPVLGLWFNHFGFPQSSDRPFRCIAVEPCSSASDVLDDLETSEHRLIAPGAVAEWSVRLEIRSRITE